MLFLMSSKKAEADIYNELSHDTCYSENESRVLSLRFKECNLDKINLATCEDNRSELISHGYKTYAFYEKPLFWGIVGLFVGAIANNNLGGK